MKAINTDVDQFLPHGELLRGFLNQGAISKGDLKRTLRKRGVFMPENEKEQLIPFLISILLSPSEYTELRECLNTREDNTKKSSSRIPWNSSRDLVEAIPEVFPIKELFEEEYSNYKFKYPPRFLTIDGDRNKIKIEFEIIRNDLNKSWYESHNEFSGNLFIEKISDDELQIIRSFTSSETEVVGRTLEKFVVKKCKEQNDIDEEKELDKILFSSFRNSTRIAFFWRLSTSIKNEIFEFEDLNDIQLRPDPNFQLPSEINWMTWKEQLIMKGRDLHNTFFIKDKRYYDFLQLWGIESRFKFKYLGLNGTLLASFEFGNFQRIGVNAEFEIKIHTLVFDTSIDNREKEKIKQRLLEALENQKNDIYKRYMEYLRNAEAELES